MYYLLLYAFGFVIISFYFAYKRKVFKYNKSVINTETGKPVPVVPPTFPIGSDYRLFTYKTHDFLFNTNEKLGKVWLYYLASNPVLAISDATLTKTILNSNSSDFDKGFFNESLTRVFGKSNLFVSDGEDWRRQRKIMGPAFTPLNIHSFTPNIQTKCRHFVDLWKTMCENSQNQSVLIDIAKESPTITRSVITSIAFNDDNAEEEIYKAVTGVVMGLINITILHMIPFTKYLPDALKGIKIIDRSIAIFDKWVKKVINSAENDVIKSEMEKHKKSFAHILVKARDEESNGMLTDKEVRDNIALFYFAGQETTATLLTYCLYYMTQNVEAQKKMQEESDRILSSTDDNITPSQIEQMDYISNFVNETLRLWCPVKSITRVANKDITLGKYFIPKNTFMQILVQSLHCCPEYWGDDANKFIPERWEKLDIVQVRKDGYFIPFSIGVRLCIGQRLATQEMIQLLSLVAKYFDISAPVDLGEVKPDAFNRAARPQSLKLLFKLRNKKKFL